MTITIIYIYAGLTDLLQLKQDEDAKAAKIARELAKENATLAAAEAAAAANDWERVYALRVERENAQKRAEEAQVKLREIEAVAAKR